MDIICRIKTVHATQWVVELTTASMDLENDTAWEEKYCGKDECALLLSNMVQACTQPTIVSSLLPARKLSPSKLVPCPGQHILSLGPQQQC